MTIKPPTTSSRTPAASDGEATTTMEANHKIPGPALARLAAEVIGPVLVPGDEQYAAETATWNLAVAYQPAVVVGATCAADVQAAVRFASAHNVPVAAIATGHGVVAAGDGAVLINLRRMDSIVIDQEQRTATIGAAVPMQMTTRRREAARASGGLLAERRRRRLHPRRWRQPGTGPRLRLRGGPRAGRRDRQPRR